MAARKQPVGNELQVAARRDVLVNLHIRKLPHELRKAAARDKRPHREFVVAINEPPHHDAPNLLRRIRKSQAAERYRLQHHVSVLRELRLRVPQRLETRIVALPVRGDSVELNRVRIDVEPVRVFAVVKGIDIDRHAVVGFDVLPLGDPRADLRRIILTDPAHVKVAVVERKIGRSRLAHRSAVARVHLAEIRDRELFLASRAITKSASLGALVTRGIRSVSVVDWANAANRQQGYNQEQSSHR